MHDNIKTNWVAELNDEQTFTLTNDVQSFNENNDGQLEKEERVGRSIRKRKCQIGLIYKYYKNVTFQII